MSDLNTPRTELERDMIDGPALELAMLPEAERAEKIVAMHREIVLWVREEFPEIDEMRQIGAARCYCAAIVARALAITRASGQAVGRG